MKTAYELAMERLEAASGPTRRLSEEEKTALAEIDSKYDAQLAGIRINFDSKIAVAASYEELDALKADMAREIASLEERRTRDKDAIWGES